MSKKITGVRATGSVVVVELLSANEAVETVLELSANTKLEAPQAHVVDIGPALDRRQWGFDVGDRIVFSGMMTPLPKGDSGRQRGTIDAFAVKAVLLES